MHPVVADHLRWLAGYRYPRASKAKKRYRVTDVVAGPLRRLPIPLTPVDRETLESFLHRLAAVNHLDPDDLAVAAGRDDGVSAAALAALTGRGVAELVQALPEFESPQARFVPNQVLQACPRCTHRHPGGPVRIHPRPHQHVCLRHRLWLGSLSPGSTAVINTPGPVDISVLPEVVTAQRRHHRLLRRHGDHATSYVVNVAVDAWDRAHRYDLLGRRQWRRLHRLRPGATRVSLGDPAAHAVCYPDIITIAGVLASPHWQAIAANLFTENTVYIEIIRRLREGDDHDPFDDADAIWPTSRHPLRYWAEGHQQDRRRRDPDGHWDAMIAHLPQKAALLGQPR